MEIWRIDVEKQTLSRELVPDSWMRLGGRALLAQIMVDEVPPTCLPLGPDNKLIFAPGLLVGHMLSSCDRISIGGKSPLTGGIKESNAGGRTGFQLTNLGIKALIIEGKPQGDGSWLIHLSSAGVRFEKAGDLSGLGVYETASRLLNLFGKQVAISLIGPGGEMELRSAGIQNIDKDGVPSRIAARGGLGAVLHSKGAKAIIIDASGGSKPPLVDEKAFRAAQKVYNKALLGHPQTHTYADYGTAAMASMCNAYGGLPTRNFSTGQFEKVDQLSGEHMRQLLLERGGESETTHACMNGCVIRCSNVFGGKDGKAIVSPLEYETIGLMGSNLGIGNLDDIAKLNWEANDLGLDTIELGAALGVAAEAGLMEFGDGKRALELVDEIRAGTLLGNILGNGAEATGRELGIERVPTVKGQAMSAYDPRAIKGTGVTYATSPQGADHTAGLTIRADVDHTDPKGQAELSRDAQIKMAGYDTLGACLFSGFGYAVSTSSISDLLNARYGWDVDEEILRELGRVALKLEREFNRGAGFTAADDRIPKWMTEESLSPSNAIFDVPEEDLDSLFNW
ncbi:MAG TPA: aldehyde ferredoxin oxidoreductase [Chloroflexi bacterium]|nr:aldehyde ferredoxin oxidoreductase [Chloroflexota bacterium]